jgi:hypothetical protein
MNNTRCVYVRPSALIYIAINFIDRSIVVKIILNDINVVWRVRIYRQIVFIPYQTHWLQDRRVITLWSYSCLVHLFFLHRWSFDSRFLWALYTTIATVNVTLVLSLALSLSLSFSRMYIHIRTICILLSTLPIHSFIHSYISYAHCCRV